VAGGHVYIKAVAKLPIMTYMRIARRPACPTADVGGAMALHCTAEQNWHSWDISLSWFTYRAVSPVYTVWFSNVHSPHYFRSTEHLMILLQYKKGRRCVEDISSLTDQAYQIATEVLITKNYLNSVFIISRRPVKIISLK